MPAKAWELPEIFLRIAWNLSDICLWFDWHLHVICLLFVFIWDLHVICMRFAKTFMRFIFDFMIFDLVFKRRQVTSIGPNVCLSVCLSVWRNFFKHQNNQKIKRIKFDYLNFLWRASPSRSYKLLNWKFIFMYTYANNSISFLGWNWKMRKWENEKIKKNQKIKKK